MKLERYKIFNALFILSVTSIILILIVTQPHKTSVKLYALYIAVIIYLVWALIYHKIDKSLTYLIFLEYLLTAGLILTLLMGTLIP
ncbi:MAG: hypothetical protein Q8P92_01545 [Candidatus Daviesbacteria bacterium]|nr:hypothetical protein [Candidatus Daviesbacteria bacterium]